MKNDYEKFDEIAEVLKALAHPVRLCIVAGLIEKGKCNVGHMQMCLELPQSTVSQHLQKLRTAGIIEGKRTGLEISYEVIDTRVINIMKKMLSE